MPCEDTTRSRETAADQSRPRAAVGRNLVLLRGIERAVEDHLEYGRRRRAAAKVERDPEPR